MKFAFIAAAASVLIASAATTAPFPQPQSSATVATQLSYSSIKYTIAHGAHTSFLLPVTNRPIHMMVACTTNGDRGVGSVTILRADGSGSNFLEWVGSDIASNNGLNVNPAVPVDQGIGLTEGAHIMFADFGSFLDVEVNNSNSVKIENTTTTTGTTLSVVVTMMY